MPSFRFFLPFACLWLLFAFSPGLRAANLNTITGLQVQNGVVTVEFATNPSVYYSLEHSFNLQTWGVADMSLGIASQLNLAPGTTQSFFRAFTKSVYAPEDTDKDGMDDLWEMGNPHLDPINPADAAFSSPNTAGLSNLQEYRTRFGLSSASPQYHSREVTLFNLGSASGAFEAISREQSLYNFGSPSATVEAVAREVSVFNGDHLPIAGYPAAHSREQTVFNLGSPSANIEAVAREVSVFNGDHLPTAGYPAAFSREQTVFNLGIPSASVEAISREISIFNNIN